ncbi:MAG: fatty acid desaturase [Synechocystis sp.]|nr:fatty acid desaturase [Synechocystis sp.]
MIKKSDFILQPYSKSNNLWATWQVLSTLGPIICLWVLAIQAVAFSAWLLVPIILLMTLFSSRCFSLMHDCGHYSLFTSKKANRAIGFIFGVLNAIPQYPWSRGHAFHHKTNGDWEKYRGPSALISTEDFAQLSPQAQGRYEFIRHPLMLLPGGFFYLAIKPRLALILGIYGFIQHALANWKANPELNMAAVIASYRSKHWYTKAEFWDLLFNNICVIGGWIAMSYWLGAGFFFSVYFTNLTLSAAIFIYVFFVQHNFEGSYAHRTEGWDYLQGAIAGSSYLELPGILKWFTASIGFHNIHHLSERIPNYHLEACHQANLHLLGGIKTLHLRDLPACAKYILWDAETSTLISITEFRRQAQLKAKQSQESPLVVAGGNNPG